MRGDDVAILFIATYVCTCARCFIAFIRLYEKGNDLHVLVIDFLILLLQ